MYVCQSNIVSCPDGSVQTHLPMGCTDAFTVGTSCETNSFGPNEEVRMCSCNDEDGCNLDKECEACNEDGTQQTVKSNPDGLKCALGGKGSYEICNSNDPSKEVSCTQTTLVIGKKMPL